MKNELIIPIPEVIDKDTVKAKVQRVGVRGLNIEEAEKLGLFNRISVLICAMHSLTLVEQKLYGQIDELFAMSNARKHDIKQACSKYQKSVDEWFRYWKEYQTEAGAHEMNKEAVELYHQFLRWTGIPEDWQLGDPQEAESETEPLIVIETEEKIWRLYRDSAEQETLEEGEDEWGVFCADRKEGNRVLCCAERGMDKASAMMSAKRMSANNPENIYLASLMKKVVEKRTDITPYKAYKAGVTVGDIKKVRKK